MTRIYQSKFLTGLLAHSVHLLLLVLPTLALRSLTNWDGPMVLFATAMMVAGISENVCQVDSQPNVTISELETKDTHAMRVASIVGLLLLVLFWLAQIESHFTPCRWWLPEISGLLALATGIYLRSAAILTLGPAFVSDIRCSGPLAHKGIYRWLKHPSEVGLLLIAVGVPLLLCSPLTLFFSLATLTPFSIWRIRRENAFLSQHTLQTARE